MKRYISVVFAVLAVILISQPAFTRECDIKLSKQGCEYVNNIGRNKFATLKNWKPFLPTDLVHTENDHRGKMCDENGYPNGGKPGTSCIPVYSPSTRKNYIVGLNGRDGDRIFIMVNKKPKLLVHLDGGSSYEGSSNRVIYASPEALQFAEDHGYVLDKRNNTMVAKGDLPKDNTQVVQPSDNPTTPQTTSVVDCASKTVLLEKMKCIADNAAVQNK